MLIKQKQIIYLFALRILGVPFTQMFYLLGIS